MLPVTIPLLLAPDTFQFLVRPFKKNHKSLCKYFIYFIHRTSIEKTKAMCPYWLGFSEIRVKIHVPDDFQTAATAEHFTDGCHQTGGHTTAYALDCAVEWLHLYAARAVKHGAASGGNSQSCKHLWHRRLVWGSLPCPCAYKMFRQSRLSGQIVPGVSTLAVHGAKGWRDTRESLYSVYCGIFFRKATEPGLGISDLNFQGLLWIKKKA